MTVFLCIGDFLAQNNCLALLWSKFQKASKSSIFREFYTYNEFMLFMENENILFDRIYLIP